MRQVNKFDVIALAKERANHRSLKAYAEFYNMSTALASRVVELGEALQREHDRERTPFNKRKGN